MYCPRWQERDLLVTMTGKLTNHKWYFILVCVVLCERDGAVVLLCVSRLCPQPDYASVRLVARLS